MGFKPRAPGTESRQCYHWAMPLHSYYYFRFDLSCNIRKGRLVSKIQDSNFESLKFPISTSFVWYLFCELGVQVEYPHSGFLARHPEIFKMMKILGSRDLFLWLSTYYQCEVDTNSLKYAWKKYYFMYTSLTTSLCCFHIT